MPLVPHCQPPLTFLIASKARRYGLPSASAGSAARPAATGVGALFKPLPSSLRASEKESLAIFFPNGLAADSLKAPQAIFPPRPVAGPRIVCRAFIADG